jgi:hypothetical protein
MTPRPPRDLLEELRTSLVHFDENDHIGDCADVAEIKRRLIAGIAEVEGQLRRTAENLHRRASV